MRSFDEARDELRAAVVACGFPEQLALALEAGLKGEGSIRRMSSYLRGAHPRSMEEVADEMVAICAVRDSWVERKVSEHAQASLTAFYNRPRKDD